MDIEQQPNKPPTLPPQSLPTSNICPDTPNLIPTHQQPHLYEPELMLQEQVKCTIETGKNKLEVVGQLYIYDNQYVLEFWGVAGGMGQGQGQGAQAGQLVLLNVGYGVTETVGTSGTGLLIFINSDKGKGQEPDPDQPDDNIADQVLSLLQKQQKGNFYLRGQCTLTLQLASQQKTQKAYELLSLYVGEEDEGNSQYEDDQDMGEMISADNIDQQGNVVFPAKEEEEDEEEEEEGEGEENQMEDENPHHQSKP